MRSLIKQTTLEMLLTESKRNRIAEEERKRGERRIERERLLREREEKREQQAHNDAPRLLQSTQQLAEKSLCISRRLNADEALALASYMRRSQARMLAKGLCVAVGAPLAVLAADWLVFGFTSVLGVSVTAAMLLCECTAFLHSLSARPKGYNWRFDPKMKYDGFLTRRFREWIVKPLIFLAKGHYGRFSPSYSGDTEVVDELRKKICAQRVLQLPAAGATEKPAKSRTPYIATCAEELEYEDRTRLR